MKSLWSTWRGKVRKQRFEVALGLCSSRLRMSVARYSEDLTSLLLIYIHATLRTLSVPSTLVEYPNPDSSSPTNHLAIPKKTNTTTTPARPSPYLPNPRLSTTSSPLANPPQSTDTVPHFPSASKSHSPVVSVTPSPSIWAVWKFTLRHVTPNHQESQR
jgi:hypothetical protein